VANSTYDAHGFEDCTPFSLPIKDGTDEVATSVTYREITNAQGGIGGAGYDVQFRFTTTEAADITAILLQLPGTQAAGTGVNNGDGTWTFGEFVFKVDGAAITGLTSTGEGSTDYEGNSKNGDFDLRIDVPDNTITQQVTVTIAFADGRNLDLDQFGDDEAGGFGLLAGLRYRQVGADGEGSGKQAGEIIIDCPEPGKIEIIKYLDNSGDGAIVGDSVLASPLFTFRVDGFLKDGTAFFREVTDNGDGDLDATAGKVLIGEIEEGSTYTVSELTKEGWYATLGKDGYEGGIEDGETDRHNFANTQKGSISGEKKIDYDGVLGGETAAGANWTINLYNDANKDGVADGPAIATTVTGADGSYSFGGLKLGDYLVEEVQKDGYYSISPEKVKVGLNTSGEHDGDTDFVNV
jgi:hypothetical protein